MKKTPAVTNTNTTPYWSYPAAELLTALDAAPGGLSADEAANRLEHDGPNVLEPRRSDNALRSFVSQFTNPLVLILIFAAVISAIAGEWTDAVIVAAIVLISAVLTFTQEYTASQAVKAAQPGHLRTNARMVKSLCRV